MVNRWFTSDLHFGHKKINSFCNRPWDSMEDMENGLISNWNALVGENDEVYLLGDIFFCGVGKAVSIMDRLKGKKHLIRGNHDWSLVRLHDQKKFRFETITDSGLLTIGDELVMLNHFPYTGDHTDGPIRYPHLRPQDNGGWLLHGHVHNLWRIKNRQINVGCDVWHWTPVHEDEISLIIRSSKF